MTQNRNINVYVSDKELEMIMKKREFEDKRKNFLIPINNQKIEEQQINQELQNKARTEYFLDNVLKTEISKYITKRTTFLKSEAINAILTAPTQVGKTAEIKNIINKCFQLNHNVIISTDNKTDQLIQLHDRLNKYGHKLIKIKDKNASERIKECISNNENFVLFCMDGYRQIDKVNLIFQEITDSKKCTRKFEKTKKIVFIHDEGDNITKDKDVQTVQISQPKSHVSWIQLFDFLSRKFQIKTKRIFVTATPDNIQLFRGVESCNYLNIPIGSNYSGWNKIEFNDIADQKESDIIESEYSRIISEKSNEIILLATERSIDDQNELLRSYSRENPFMTVNTYNGKSIRFITTNPILIKKLQSVEIDIVKNGKSKTKVFKSINQDEIIILKKDITIQHFYRLCQDSGETAILTIGKDLLNRGISFVAEKSKCVEKPLCASVMVLRLGKKMHCVGINQIIGRITGTARPELQRRLYSTKSIIDDYKNYNMNQENFKQRMESLLTEDGILNTTDLMKSMEFQKVFRPTDRKKLDIDSHLQFIQLARVINTDDMKKNIDYWLSKSDELQISKILLYIYENCDRLDPITEIEVRSYIKSLGSTNINSQYRELFRLNDVHSTIFQRTNGIVSLTVNAKNYMNSKNIV